MTTARTRRVHADDAAALAAIDEAAFDAPWDLSTFRSLLAGSLTLGWRRDVHGAPVAAALVRVVAGEGELLRLAVHPSARRQGHARALVEAILADLAGGLPYGLHLEVRASNEAARALYRATGFAEVGRRPDYYASPVEDAVLMRWWPSPDGACRDRLAPPGSRW